STGYLDLRRAGRRYSSASVYRWPAGGGRAQSCRLSQRSRTMSGQAAAPAREQFIDFYELMQISPNAELDTIQRVYRMLVVRYHPDNPHTGDVDKFLLLKQAYETLCDAQRRAIYDLQYGNRVIEPLPVFELKEF